MQALFERGVDGAARYGATITDAMLIGDDLAAVHGPIDRSWSLLPRNLAHASGSADEDQIAVHW